MSEEYKRLIETTNHQLATLLLEKLDDHELAQHTMLLDKQAADVLRQVGLRTMEVAFAQLSDKVTVQAQATGLGVHRGPVVSFNVIFGPFTVKSLHL